MKKMFAYGVVLLIVWIIAGSWGFLVHRTISQLAIYELPNNPGSFFHQNMNYLVTHSVRADLRRQDDSTEDSKHYINFETFGDSAAWKMPLAFKEAVQLYSKDSLLKHGYMPYYVITMKNQLTNAFRKKNRDSILFYAADLAHYIGDVHVPLHTTRNYDGQLTNQKGLHSLWESVIPEIELDKYDLASAHQARYLKNPEKSIWQAVRNAHNLTTNVLRLERESSMRFTDSSKYRVQIRRGKEVRYYSTRFAKEYSKLLGKSINQQLVNSADLIADFWYTSWVDAGKPDMKPLMKSTTADPQNHALKKERKAFQENNLMKEKLLISRQNTTTNVP